MFLRQLTRQFHTTRHIEKGKKSLRQHRKGAMSAKRSPQNFYKGTGGRKEGRHTSKGAYVIDKTKLLNIVVPTTDLKTFKLKPYVAHKTLKVSTLEIQSESQ